MILKTLHVGPMQANCYLLAREKGAPALIIDPGAQEKHIRKALGGMDATPGLVINTHGHYDHIGCDDAFGVPIYVHQADLPMLKDARRNLSALFDTPLCVAGELRTVKEGDSISLDSISLKVLHIPGHTPGGMALVLEDPRAKVVFTGDSLFFHAIGRFDLEGGDEQLLVRSIKTKILALPDETVVYPGHGASSTVGEERRNNPFLQHDDPRDAGP